MVMLFIYLIFVYAILYCDEQYKYYKIYLQQGGKYYTTFLSFLIARFTN